MADEQKIQAPAGALAPKPDDTAIFVMPEKYRGGKEKMAEAKKPVVVAPAPPPKPVVVPPAPLKKPAPKPRAGIKVIIIIGVFLLVALGGGGYFLLRGTRPATPVTPTPVAPTPVTPTPVQPTPTQPSAPRPGTDSDTDGLTDLEEQLLYGTNPRLADTDSDGFLDGNEVFHRYNPAGTAPGTLEGAGLARAFENDGYALLYPSAWTAEASGTGALFTASSGETVAVTVATSPSGLDAWIAGHPDATFTRFTTKNGFPAAISNDQLLVGVDGTSGFGTPTVVEWTYAVNGKATIDYLQTFKMMINSLSFR